ncbi:hypothetical protein JRO89_XS05G0110700 [Xanthoceras sorbifolium]|uniref:C2 NT-type domain-containing protein n=1 Tax=Xanthoceras sorbifolium TaxID=99658 RepID=A0ABQ8I1H2_9ROSI|nr:hypothetical protein JRO89_XS05G0110700 [Xanthoceras sorbifolium]
MVLGLRKKKKRSSVQVDYWIHVQEVKPWPPSQSSKPVQSVLLQWVGDQGSGSFASGVGDGKLEFNESFRLSVTMCQEGSRKGTANDSFQKNYLEFYLYETGKDKAVKGQVLGLAVVNFADYGIIKEAVAISTQINLKKSSRNVAQPILYLIIEPLYKDGSSSSPKVSLCKETSLDKNGSGSLSELTNEGNDEECEIASFTEDDDVSSHSSWTNSSSALETTRSSPAQSYKNGSESAKDGMRMVNQEPALPSSIAPAKQELNPVVETLKNINGSSSTSSATNISSESGSSVINPAAKVASSGVYNHVGINSNQVRFENSLTTLEDDRTTRRYDKNGLEEATTNNSNVSLLKEQEENGLDNHFIEVKKNDSTEQLALKLPQDATTKQVRLRSNTLANSRTSLGEESGSITNNKLKHVKSVQLHSDPAKSNGPLSNSQFMGKGDEINIAKDVHYSGMNNAQSRTEETIKGFSDSKAELVSKIEMLEEELREAAAVEVGLYSVVAEHGSSPNKVHAPARRLARFYLHACKTRSQAKTASAARAAISGLVLVSKACGHDVPRLTFWLSNSVVLRAIVGQLTGKLQFSDGTCIKHDGDIKGMEEEFAPKRHESTHDEKVKSNSKESPDDWEDPLTFIVALEKFEAWIFSRIIESVWWQTLTPHMQSAAAKGSSSRKTSGRRHGLGDQEQGNFSIELWKKAFKDACERLCPTRAGGHECGCLPVLSKMVMEQLVGRLDVAMFNAILRESAEEMPTDPVSDPISDSKVLPIPAGKSSFGAGAQLKNAIGNWSRWLTDLFGIDDNDALEDMTEVCDEKKSMENETSFKPFPLLNALSDLMMLPFEMLADSSTRKEVCPTLSVPLIMRVLNYFVPDEFNPDPIPHTVFEALDSEGLCEAEEESRTNFPCMASPSIYSPPTAASLTAIIGEVGSQTLQRSGSAVLKKAYTSDDELDELDSPLTSIIVDNSGASSASAAPKAISGRKVVRYQLLREAWRDGE